MRPLYVMVEGIPKAQPRKRAVIRRFKNGALAVGTYDPGTAQGWKHQIAKAVQAELQKQGRESLPDEALTIDLEFSFVRPKSHLRANGLLRPKAPERHIQKPDKDNLEKAVLDSLVSYGILRDDCLVWCGRTTKLWVMPHERPGVFIAINTSEELL